ncbi:LysR family transcriptional regulator [Shewanella eurypsychrophilus]|uniref:LysR family transcriptional regulator n=1 Tax=Shewanella eurypsychrophilus TaxID=2593656 RepID=A0ABX6V5J4_9GAMM|nr:MULTISPECIES: LysR family transcriptional regulator [Shewanella]QFU22633.1 LysR family transcriptional regulator [Shewanella sp. YLB-09]QPG57922.1 LysR family transcriptional regulator [Shewanella eurypsychrophilus]
MDRAKSTLEQWRILQAVVDFGGYSQAAQALNKSQSSLNHAVAKLQTQLGIQLLEVKGRKAYLTEQGTVLLRRSRHITQSVSELELLANNLENGWEPTLTIAREIIYPMDMLVDSLAKFQPESRGTRITIIDSVISGTHDLIKQQAVDIAICGGVPPKGHISEPLCELDFLLVCHPDHDLAIDPNICDDQTLAQHLQIVIKDTGQATHIDMGWLKAEQRWTVSNFHEALVILNRSLGFCWVPKYLVEPLINDGKLCQLNLKGNSHRKVMMSLVIPNRDLQGPASELLEKMIIMSHR